MNMTSHASIGIHRLFRRKSKWQLLLLLLLTAIGIHPNGWANLVKNGDFEEMGWQNQFIKCWGVGGPPGVRPPVMRDAGPDQTNHSAKLVCPSFVPAPHEGSIMLVQDGQINVSSGKWYKLSFWAKGESIQANGFIVDLTDKRRWNQLVSQTVVFGADNEWKRYDVVFQAKVDLPAEKSVLRFQIQSSGTFWLAKVDLDETTPLQTQWHPELPVDGRINLIPNSSFEAGTAGWGSQGDLKFWYGNTYQLLGSIVATGMHGGHSLCLNLSEEAIPERHFDDFSGNHPTGIHDRPNSVVEANVGWIPVEKGAVYTLSAYLKTDKPGNKGYLVIQQAGANGLLPSFKVGGNALVPLTGEWKRYSVSVTAQVDYAYVGVGGGQIKWDNPYKIWIDAVQFEKGPAPTAYQPSLPIEVTATTRQEGNTFVLSNPPYEIPLQLHAFNNAGVQANARVTLSVKDFFDQEVFHQDVTFPATPGVETDKEITLPVGKLGFYKVAVFAPSQAVQQLRCLVINPTGYEDSRFGMNHDYPFNFLQRTAQKFGVWWWRDWSVVWGVVQPKGDSPLDFSSSDLQIDRVLKDNGKVFLTFPNSATLWTADPAINIHEAWIQPWQVDRIKTASYPQDEKAFENYIRGSVRHYKNRIHYYGVFNEAFVPGNDAMSPMSRIGAERYKVSDYIHLLSIAYKAIKEEQPDAEVVCGIHDPSLAKDFIKEGGLAFVDDLDLHYYPSPVAPESILTEEVELEKMMQEKNAVKPIFITELGCYADDDPAQTPYRSTDPTTDRCIQSSEKDLAVWYVKFGAYFFAHGGVKIFPHAGITAMGINDVEHMVVYFAYGGYPRKIAATTAVMARLLPTSAKFARVEQVAEKATVYWFSTPKGEVGIGWSTDGKAYPIKSTEGVRVLDIMGNPIAGSSVEIGRIPVYLLRAP